jgi:hypothetical protein
LSREWLIGEEEVMEFKVFPRCNEITGFLITSKEDQLHGMKIMIYLPRRVIQLFNEQTVVSRER